jgi:hypothetical protein
MELDHALSIIRQGQREDWNVIVDSDRTVAAYKPDLNLTIAWGLPRSDRFDEPWATKFADGAASSAFLEVFYAGALVFRDFYVSVDGGRADLPVPSERDGIITISREQNLLIRSISALQGEQRLDAYEQYFRRAGFRVMDSWQSH